jgi:FKBP-type peptidyl-prolyl cis-trans isomerase (trigger factor)
MKVAVKKVDALKRELSFEIPKDRVSAAHAQVMSEITKVAKVKGFRPGKAPRQMIESQHGALAREEVIKKLIPEVYQEGIDQEKIDALDLPEIHDVEYKDGLIRFKAHVDIKPEVKLGNYKGIKVTRKSSKVTDEELEKTLEYFKKAGGEKEQVVDDNFVKSLGYPSLAQFKESLTRQMEMDKDRQNRIDVENQLIDALIKDAKLAVPESLVKRQLEHRMHDMQHRMKDQGMPEAEIKKREEEMRKEFEKTAEKDVKVYLILGEIAKLEGIHIHSENESLPAKVMAYLLKEASWEEAKEEKAKK